MRIKTALLLAAGCAALASCTSDGKIRPAFDNWGEANRQTMMAQVIDPDPQYDTAIPASSGKHAADAIDRYNKGTVKQPDRTATSTLGSGSGSSGSSGGN